MATHDYIISNASGAAVRADLNNALAAIATNNSSATEPTTTYAYQWWADTGSSPTVMKLRNAANSGWITLFQLDGEWTVVPFENGTAAAPSIYFKDSGTDTGIYSPGTDQVAITTGGTARLYVGSTGAVGIGTTSPGGTLDVGAVAGAVTAGDLTVTTGSTTAKVTIGRLSSTSNDSTSFRIRDRIDRDVLTVDAGNFVYSQSGSERARIDGSGRFLVGLSSSIESTSKLQVKDGSLNIYHASAAAGAGYAIFFTSNGNSSALAQAKIEGLQEAANTSGGRLVFSTSASGSGSPTERMRITNDGALKVSDNGTYNNATNTAHEINNSGTSAALQLFGRHATTPYGYFYRSTAADPNNTTQYVFKAEQNTGVNIYTIWSNGTVTARSDARYKKNIETTRDGYLEDLSQLRVVKYNWYNHEDDAPKELGFIAQEVEQIFPGLVMAEPEKDEDGNETGEVCKSIKFSVLTPMLVKALQEAHAKIEQLESRLTALEGA